MSQWTHPCCDGCFEMVTGKSLKHAVRFKEDKREAEICCFCQFPTQSGIYVRHEPLAKCGQHD